MTRTGTSFIDPLLPFDKQPVTNRFYVLEAYDRICRRHADASRNAIRPNATDAEVSAAVRLGIHKMNIASYIVGNQLWVPPADSRQRLTDVIRGQTSSNKEEADVTQS